MLKNFRAVSVVEGLSFLTILCVSFGIISRDFVFYIGMFHGVLFIAYLMLSLLVTDKKGWSIFIWLALFLAAVIPLAFIIVELFLRKESMVTNEIVADKL
ncbi:MAG: DUF3817 domain-containing protein [Piscirickettsiaceae bacterium]|nr:DUF3817 domain-containing protein [Piscirickettsiaceae bacterium]